MPRFIIFVLLMLSVSSVMGLDLKQCEQNILAGGVGFYDLTADKKKVDDLRVRLKQAQQKSQSDAIRNQLTEIAVKVLNEAIKAYARGAEKQQLILEKYYNKRLNDTLWRMGYRGKNGDQKAALAAAWVYSRGLHIDKDQQKACSLFTLASDELGAASFQNSLCVSEYSPGLSVQFLGKASKQGDPVAQETMGRLCLEGQQHDIQCALDYFCLAAQQGRASASSLAGWILMENGEQTQALAQKYLIYGASHGDLAAQNNLGKLLESTNPQKAVYWYESAANSGFVPAQVNLGRAYAVGIGTKENQKLAIFWARKAKQAGSEQGAQLLSWLMKR